LTRKLQCIIPTAGYSLSLTRKLQCIIPTAGYSLSLTRSYNVLSQPLGIVYLWQAMLCEVGITSINTFFLAQIPVEITSMHITRYPVIALKTVKVAIGFS